MGDTEQHAVVILFIIRSGQADQHQSSLSGKNTVYSPKLNYEMTRIKQKCFIHLCFGEVKSIISVQDAFRTSPRASIIDVWD